MLNCCWGATCFLKWVYSLVASSTIYTEGPFPYSMLLFWNDNLQGLTSVQFSLVNCFSLLSFLYGRFLNTGFDFHFRMQFETSILESGLQKTWISAGPLSKQLSHFACLFYSSYLMILLEDDLLCPCPLRKSALKVTICLSRTTRRDFFRAPV